MNPPYIHVPFPPTLAEKRAIVTTSWDDGQATDFRMMELLSSFGIRGTFFVPLRFKGRPAPLAEALPEIPGDFEIGGHSANHLDLRGLDAHCLREEVEGSKAQLEARGGAPVRVFSYPMGRHDAAARRAVRKAGYLSARITEEYCVHQPADPYQTPTTLSAYPLTRWRRLLREFRAYRWMNVAFLARNWNRTWRGLAVELFAQARRRGGIWHLWGHSWEIERLGLWEQLGEVLRAVAHHGDVHYCTNGELAELLSAVPLPAGKTALTP